MKILLKRRLLLISLIVTILVLAITGTVLAATLIVIPAKVSVVAATYDIQVYSDPACTMPLTSLVWASDLPQGGERVRTIYLKNVGNMDAFITASLQSPPAGVTIVNNTTTISRGTSTAFDIDLEASASAQIGSSQSFTININSSAPPPPAE